MDKCYSWKKTEEPEIDVADLLKKICKRWKQVMLCAIVCTVVLTGYGYFKNRVFLDEAAEAEDIVLTEAERQNVADAISLKIETGRLKEYLEHSILMQTDPYHKNTVVMLYSIEEAKNREIQKIMESYLSFITNGGVVTALKDSSNSEWNADKCYLTELIHAYQKTYSYPYQIMVDSDRMNIPLTALFCVEITGKDNQMAGKLAENVQDVLKDFSDKTKRNTGKHKLKLISIESSIIADSGLQTKQHEIKSQLSVSLANLNAMRDVFNEKQQEVYRNNTEGSEDEDNIENNTGDNEEIYRERAGIYVKYIFLGFFGGVCMYCCIFAAWYLSKDTIKNEQELKTLYTLPYYGHVSLTKSADRNLSSVQKEKLEQEKILILNRMKMSCERQGITRLCLVTEFPFGEQEKGCLKKIKEQMKAWGIDTFLAENAGSDVTVWDRLLKAGYVIMICQIGTTTHRMIDDEMKFCLENGVTVAGMMAFV